MREYTRLPAHYGTAVAVACCVSHNVATRTAPV